MALKVSPLAPSQLPELPAIVGLSLGAVAAGIKYRGRKDLAVMAFDHPAEIAGVFTKSRCASAPVDWCRKMLGGGQADVLVVNSGNANAFTGKKGVEAVTQTARAAAAAFGCKQKSVFLASTGVIGEPLDASRMERHLVKAKAQLDEQGWEDMARAIMTTDTYPKMATQTFEVDGKAHVLNGMAKGSGMIQPDLATMLAFLATDFPISSSLMQKLLSRAVEGSFNSISVDSDTSTSDTVLVFSVANGQKPAASSRAKGVREFGVALEKVLHELAMLTVRDGEGASKHVEIRVSGAKTSRSAKRIALTIANSPLVKTAIAGEDPNWGRIVMAVGKAGEPANRDRLKISFGKVCVAKNGERAPDYSEKAAAKIMKSDYIPIHVDVGVGVCEASVWTCDFTADYVSINADYRS